MIEKSINVAINKKTPSDEYKALVRAAESAKKQAELLGLPYITQNKILDISDSLPK